VQDDIRNSDPHFGSSGFDFYNIGGAACLVNIMALGPQRDSLFLSLLGGLPAVHRKRG